MSQKPSTSEPTPTDSQRGAGKGDEAEDDRIGAWTNEIDSALRREKDWRTQARWLVQVYEGEKVEEVPFNILYSNTETISPAIYNNTPRPVVKPRYRATDPMPKAAADLSVALLEFFVDEGDGDAPNFDELMGTAVHEALVVDRGITRFDYDADVETDDQGPKSVKHEYICGRPVSYDRFCHGYAKKWAEVPWICYTHFLTQEEVEANKDWDEAAKRELGYTSRSDDPEKGDLSDTDKAGVQLAMVHELWDRASKKIYTFGDGGTTFLKEKADPYKLTGFFNCPRPMGFTTKISSLLPKPLYTLYEAQARELNSISNRIRVIIQAVKAVGLYNQVLEGFPEITSLEDGQLTPLKGAGAMSDAALSNAVWFWPVEKIIVVLTELYHNRESCKQVIYEITGLSDIIRGQGQASETATATNVKNQWGGLRVKRFQKEVKRYVVDSLRIACELAFTKLGTETLFRTTATTLPRQKEWDEAKKRVAQAQAAAAQAQAIPGSPPPPAPSPNDLLLIEKPVFETVVESLKNDLHRRYLISIETNSTVDAEATEDQEQVTRFLGTMAQFFGGIAPLVESGTLSFDAAKAMLLTVSRKFRLGRELDDALVAMQAPQKQEQDPEAAKKLMEQAQKLMQQAKEEQVKNQVTSIQQQAQIRDASQNLKIQGLQQNMRQSQDATKSLIASIQQGVKDTQTKALLEKLVLQLDQQHQEMHADAAHLADNLKHTAEVSDLHQQLSTQEAVHQVENVARETSHTIEKKGIQQDAKSQVQQAKTAAAAKKAPAKK